MKDMAKGFTVPGKSDNSGTPSKFQHKGKIRLGDQGFAEALTLPAYLSGLATSPPAIGALGAGVATAFAKDIGDRIDYNKGRLAYDKNFVARSQQNGKAADVMSGVSKDFTTQNTSGNRKKIIAKKFGAMGK